MEITGSTARPEADVLVVPLFEGESGVKDVPAVAQAVERGEVKGKANEVWTMSDGDGRVLVVGAGKRADADDTRLRRTFGTAGRAIRTRYASANVLLRSDAQAQAAAEGILLGSYEPDLLKSERSATKLERVHLIAKGNVRTALRIGHVVGEATNLARELVTMPPNELTPTTFAERAKAELAGVGVKVEILRGAKLAKFGGLLGVAKGSDEPPTLISMRWEPTRAKKGTVLGLVGKGVTFDSGGLSLKPADSMTWMKGDMGGGAAVIAAMKAIAQLGLPLTVKAAVPATENMPSGKATRVGDVLRLYSGKTAEILNTDAEGRLILHDALAWLGEQGVTHLADAATLTGAIEVALGNHAIGVMGRPDAFVDRVVRASRHGGERAWSLPLYGEYREQIRSDIADFKNIGGRGGGAITAAWFLAEGVPDDIPWAHLDIAGVAWGDRKPYRAAGATGAGVGAFVRLAQELAGKA
jgi:leucyl aminopeptidase